MSSDSSPTRHVIVGTAGHIDHGKTSLVRRLTGIDTDRLPEEKSRGISIDLGFAHFEAGPFQFGVVDVPGHERFVRNMVAGATAVDLALLVVAADDSVMPQTVEHLEIMDLLGVACGAVAITKIDVIEREFVELVEGEVAARLRGTFLEGCPIIPVSSQTGEGIDRLKQALVDVAGERRWLPRGELFRMPIDRVFSLAGHGTIVTGSVLAGEVRAGDVLDLLPEQQTVRVRSVETHGQQVSESGSRRRTAINLAGIKADELRRGQELAAPGYLQPTRRLLVHVRSLSSSPVTLKDRLTLNLHLGTGEVAARIILKGESLPPGGSGYAELRTATPIVATYGQRFILRRPSPALTVAGGVILDPGIEPRRRLPALDQVGAALETLDELQRLSYNCSQLDRIEAAPLAAAWKVGIPPSRYRELLDRLAAQRELAPIDRKEAGRLIHKARLRSIADLVLKRIRTEIARHQPRRALPRALLLSACQNLAPPELIEAGFELLLKERQIVAVGPHFGPADAQVQLTKAQAATRDKLLHLVGEAGLTPPTLKELATSLSQKPEAIAVLLHLCVEDGLLVRVAEDLYYPPATLERAQAICLATLASQGSATMSQLREAWGVTRKYSVPLCEYFDAKQVTLREGDLRRAGPK
ncbi:MAG: selenocysteine-specific translation elongation factor [Planctomycetales bacterium]